MNQKISPETQQQAAAIAKSTQRPGQSKEHTKLIAKGIEKGIAEYKKQQKAKSRERDKEQKRKERNRQQSLEAETHTEEKPSVTLSHFLPWSLLIVSWIGFVVYLMAIK